MLIHKLNLLAMTRTIVLLAICYLIPVTVSAQSADVLGWEQTRWGMSAEELATAVGPDLVVRQLGNGRTEYSLADYRLGGQTFGVRFVRDFAGRLIEVRVGSGFTNINRMEDAKTLEASLVNAHGRFTHVIANRTVDDGNTRLVIRKLKWLLPTTTIIFHHGMTVVPEGTHDTLTVRYSSTRGL